MSQNRGLLRGNPCWLEYVHAVILGGCFNTDHFLSRLSKLFHSWPQSPLVQAMVNYIVNKCEVNPSG